jgi:organic hydroperoxide reductase OsmC/OhrA
MTPFPHHYVVNAEGTAAGPIATGAPALDRLQIDAPFEFGGPGDRWSPENLLVAAVADCFVLTFRAVAQAAHLPWTRVECDLSGTVDRADRAPQFTHFALRARLEVPEGADPALALRALEKAHRGCLVANSLKAAIDLEPEVYSTHEAGVDPLLRPVSC